MDSIEHRGKAEAEGERRMRRVTDWMDYKGSWKEAEGERRMRKVTDWMDYKGS